MQNKIVDGDYSWSNVEKRLETVDYIDEVAQLVKIALTASRGRFYPNKDFGSLLKGINAAPYEEYALAYARQAVDAIDGVYIKRAVLENGSLVFDIDINDEERQVSIKIENNL